MRLKYKMVWKTTFNFKIVPTFFIFSFQTSNNTDFEGRYNFTCQHGPSECRGNLAHACVIDVLRNNTHAVIFNSCLMQNSFDYSDPEDITKVFINLYLLKFPTYWRLIHNAISDSVLNLLTNSIYSYIAFLFVYLNTLIPKVNRHRYRS